MLQSCNLQQHVQSQHSVLLNNCHTQCIYETSCWQDQDSPRPGIQRLRQSPGRPRPPSLVSPAPVAQVGENTAPGRVCPSLVGQHQTNHEGESWNQQLPVSAPPTTPAVPNAPSLSEPEPVIARMSTVPMAATTSALQEAVAQSKVWQKQSLQNAMAQSEAWQKQRWRTLQRGLALQQPAILLLAQEIAKPAPPVPALLTSCMATLARPVLVSLHTVAAPPVPAEPFAEALLKAIASSMAWQTKLECVPQCSVPQPPLLMAAPVVRPKSCMLEMIEKSKLWQQKQSQHQPAPTQSAVPGPTSQAVRDAISCSKRWMREQCQHVQQIFYQPQHPCRQLSFCAAWGPATCLKIPTTLRWGSLLDESQANEGMLPQTGSTSRHDTLPVATLCAVSANGANTTDVDATGGCLQLRHAAAPTMELKDEKDSKSEKDQQDEEHTDMCKQNEVAKGDSHALVENDQTTEDYHNSNKSKCFAKVKRLWANNGKRHWQRKRSGSTATERKGNHQRHRLHDNSAGSERGKGEGDGPLMAFAATQGEPGGADPSMVAACTALPAARTRSGDAKDPPSSGITRRKATSKRKRAAAVGEVKSITRILPDDMETQPADINETWFAYLMEPTLHYADAEPSSNLLDTATTLEFPGVAAVAQAESLANCTDTVLYTC